MSLVLDPYPGDDIEAELTDADIEAIYRDISRARVMRGRPLEDRAWRQMAVRGLMAEQLRLDMEVVR